MATPENRSNGQFSLFSSPLIDVEYILGPPAESMQDDEVAGGPDCMQPKVEQDVPVMPELPVPVDETAVTMRQPKRGGSKIVMPPPAEGINKKQAPAKTKTTTVLRKVTAKKENVDQETVTAKVNKQKAATKVTNQPTVDATATLPRKTYQARVTATASTSTRSGSTATATSSSKEILICYRCNCTIKGPNASKEMDKHLKDCGLVVCVLCNKKYKTVQTLQIHQRKVHAPKNE